MFSLDSKSFEKFFEPVKALKISPDSKKLAYFSDSEIWLLFLQNKQDSPQKKAGDKVFLTRLSEKIENVFWLNSDYLIFNAGDKIKIAEIDDRDGINIIDLAEISKIMPAGNEKTSEVFWNLADEKLYLFGNNVYVSEKLLP